MTRFATGLLGIGGVTVGLLLGSALTIGTTDSRERRRMVRDSKRAMRKAGHYFNEMFD
ncbi:MAG: hypothetical protein FWB96_08905 [Defluviitaleaceae bacterium]|nr:hypothetical protein [Defluviitaleaceae bacterium]MCL2262959.1 hypothetical protein [Defluviitaleaceae bacterium]